MDLAPSDEQERLREAARELLARECPSSLVRAMAEDARGAPDALWQQMAELGWMGLPFPEACGGAGLGPLELAVLLEEMGRVLLPGPFFASVVLGGGSVVLAGSAEQQARFLPGIARGAARATLALLEETERWDAEAVRLAAHRTSQGFVLEGRKRFVMDAHLADWIAVVARDPDVPGDAGVVLGIVDARAPGVAIRPTASIDGTRKFAELQLDRVRVPEDAVLAGGAGALARLLDHARVALCAEMVGGAARVLARSVDHARTREQFGRPIGSFQAIQHRCADMLVALEGARSALLWAAWCLAEGEAEAPLAAAMAKAAASDAYARIAGDGIQIHGGQGFTWEQDLHLYYRRAKVSQQLFGDAAWHRERVARAVIGPL